MSPERSNIISVSWGDHLAFGERDGRLETPEALRRRMDVWREELGADTLHWRQSRTRSQGRTQTAPGYRSADRPEKKLKVEWDDFEVVPALAREAGLRAYLYVVMFDEGRPLPSEAERKVSFHNSGHGQDIAWQSDFTIDHPEYLTEDRSGQGRQWGVLSMAYPEVRDHLCHRFQQLLDGYDFDGLFVCLRSQSKPAEFADEYGFNGPIRDEYLERYGRDIRTEDFDLQAWRDLQGEYLTQFFAQLREVTRESGHRLAIGCARGDVVGPPLGNATLQWRDWIERGLVDDLVINQSSSQCPSLWIQLWPMHRGPGYVQDYLTGSNMPAIEEHLTETYGPAVAGKPVELYVARQWSGPSPSEEAALQAHAAVTGLVFSSFRYDNAERILAHRGDWTL